MRCSQVLYHRYRALTFNNTRLVINKPTLNGVIFEKRCLICRDIPRKNRSQDFPASAMRFWVFRVEPSWDFCCEIPKLIRDFSSTLLLMFHWLLYLQQSFAKRSIDVAGYIRDYCLICPTATLEYEATKTHNTWSACFTKENLMPRFSD